MSSHNVLSGVREKILTRMRWEGGRVRVGPDTKVPVRYASGRALAGVCAYCALAGVCAQRLTYEGQASIAIAIIV